MKTLLQILFFFLLVTQINFAQLHKHISETNFKKMNGLIDRQDKQFPIINKNIQVQQSNRFLSSDFENKFQIGIDTLDMNSESYPFHNNKFYPTGPKTSSPPDNRMFLPQSQISVIDTAIVVSEQDTTRHLYTFNASAKMKTDLIQKYIGGFWIDTVRCTYTYDASNNMLSELSENWENGQWVYSYRYVYTYDANNNVLLYLREQWDQGQLVSSYMYAYTYDANNNLLTEYSEQWENGQLVYSWRITYTYDGDNNIISELWESWEKSQLKYSSRCAYTYDVNNNMLSELWERWENDQWVYSTRRTY